MNLRKIFIGLMILSVPILPYLKVSQAFRFYKLENEIESLEHQQQVTIDQNKQIEANITIYSSPSRIERLANEMDDVEKIDSSRIVHVRIKGPGGRDG